MLPAKWCIRGCKEFSIYCNQRINDKKQVNMNGRDSGNFYCNPTLATLEEGVIEKWSYHHKIPDNYTEITFEEFEKYVLNKTPIMKKEDYKYLVKLFKKLKIT